MDNMELPDTTFSRIVDGVIVRVGRSLSWLWVILLSVIVVNVLLRYLFGEGRVEFEELQWHINSVAFLSAIVYAYKTDSHIRIDLISSGLSSRARVWIEMYGTLLLLLPFVVSIFSFSLSFVAHSWTVGEISQSPGGLPYRWILKSILTGAFVFLMLGICARITRLWAFLSQNHTDELT